MLQMIQTFDDGGGGRREDAGQKVAKLRAASTSVKEIFSDSEQCTFVCVCIPEFLSLYETERLIQELVKLGIDCRNIVINQVLVYEINHGSKLLAARIQMQKKYLNHYNELYEDFHIVKVPLQENEIRGVKSLQIFSQNLI